jgi:hypothetical protein
MLTFLAEFAASSQGAQIPERVNSDLGSKMNSRQIATGVSSL